VGYQLELDVYRSMKLQIVNWMLGIAGLLWFICIVAVVAFVILKKKSGTLKQKIMKFKEKYTKSGKSKKYHEME
jgi:hypothetical protein